MCSNCASMYRQLQQLDFALHDTALYLDSHPTCQNALAYYHQMLEKRNGIADVYTVSCNPLIPSQGVGDGCWTWVQNPWPWE